MTLIGGSGYTPTLNQWHHMVVTYPGGTNGNETVYIDGRANAFQLHTLAIVVPTTWYLGTWFSSSTYFGGEFALGALRMHDHALTPAQVLFNYQADYLSYYPSPTSTQTPTSTSTPTNSPSASLSNGASPSVSNTPTQTSTASQTATPTATTSSHIQTAGLLIDMQAVDFVGGSTVLWDNRITAGTGACMHCRLFVAIELYYMNAKR